MRKLSRHWIINSPGTTKFTKLNAFLFIPVVHKRKQIGTTNANRKVLINYPEKNFEASFLFPSLEIRWKASVPEIHLTNIFYR